MIDLHCHLLHGLDDGPSDLSESLAMARVAVEEGIETIVATPHIREDHPFPLELVAERLEELGAALANEAIPLRVLAGGEVAISKAGGLDDATLRAVCLGNGPYLLVETPYTEATDLLEQTLFDLQVRGFKPLLAHPERGPSFLSDPDRLRALVERGVLCSLTADSLAGRFGETIRKLAVRLVREGLAHDVASDAHDSRRRRPALRHGLVHLAAQADWLTRAAPAAMLAGAELPEPPEPPAGAARGWRRLFGGGR